MTLLFTQGHNCFSKLTQSLTCTIIAVSRTVFKLWHSTFRLSSHWCNGSQWVGKGKKISSWISSATKQAISIKLATTVGHFLRDLDFKNVAMACTSCFLSFSCRLFCPLALGCSVFRIVKRAVSHLLWFRFWRLDHRSTRFTRHHGVLRSQRWRYEVPCGRPQEDDEGADPDLWRQEELLGPRREGRLPGRRDPEHERWRDHRQAHQEHGGKWVPRWMDGWMDG